MKERVYRKRKRESVYVEGVRAERDSVDEFERERERERAE